MNARLPKSTIRQCCTKQHAMGQDYPVARNANAAPRNTHTLTHMPAVTHTNTRKHIRTHTYANPHVWGSDSYTHLTLPTIYYE